MKLKKNSTIYTSNKTVVEKLRSIDCQVVKVKNNLVKILINCDVNVKFDL